MFKLSTTIEQGKMLLEAGVSPETADMYIDTTHDQYASFLPRTRDKNFKFESEDREYMERNGLFYAWSLNALFRLLPCGASIQKTKEGRCMATLVPGSEFKIVELDPIDACFLLVYFSIKNNKSI